MFFLAATSGMISKVPIANNVGRQSNCLRYIRAEIFVRARAMGPKNEPRAVAHRKSERQLPLEPPHPRMCIPNKPTRRIALSAPKESEYSERLSIMRTPGVLSPCR